MIETFPTAQDLAARDGRQSALREQARASGAARFGPRVFIRAVVEASNFRRENCAYCGNRTAILRLLRPDGVIPAVSALNLAQAEGGYRRGLRAGANLVTINLTPRAYRQNYVIYRRDRFIMDEGRVLTAFEAEKLSPSDLSLAAFHRRSATLPNAPPPPAEAVAQRV